MYLQNQKQLTVLVLKRTFGVYSIGLLWTHWTHVQKEKKRKKTINKAEYV